MKNTKIYKYQKTTAKNSDSEIIKSVKQYLGDEDVEISVTRDEYGKPYVYGADGVFVSVTHDKDICLVAVSDREVGIDTERVDRKIKNPAALAKRYFCDDEIAFLGENPSSLEFTDMWVKKEALAKLIGKGVPCMKDKSIFSDEIRLEGMDFCDGYILYLAFYK